MKELLTIAVTVGLIVAITLFLSHLDRSGQRQQPATVQVTEKGAKPDVQLRRIRMLRTDDFGYHKFHLQADEVRHFLQQSTELGNLRMLVTSREDADWLITAASGWMDPDQKQLLLQGEVLVHQQRDDGEDVTGITRDMIVDYANSLAYSNSSATLLTGKSMTSGTGLAIKFSNPSSINLLSRVTGTHVID
jgi:LPS export ABC transporter protein LptC